jgi:hypothetical protein
MWKFFFATGVPYKAYHLVTDFSKSCPLVQVLMTYLVAHVIVAGAIHVDIGPLLEPGGFNGCELGGAVGRFGHETLTGLDCPLVFEVQ